ncbi:hypothetical protein EGW08_012442 [Elysia chlorotica]|uniref:Disease resistance R13L4/SHOC-2-like LRR domain-containing protein n=1 Tax=Elysia chlorotica TaxID=188477 RepID=A0A3S0ZKF3_ELYCH|nr:hypothetical protein EGW08_012442 [Elysia chlorotica]
MAGIIQRIQKLWQRLLRKNDTADVNSDHHWSAQCEGQEKRKTAVKFGNNNLADVFRDVYTFAQYVNGETKENARKVTTLSVVQTGSCPSPEIPIAIGRFSELTCLQVSGCGLTALPWSLVYLKRLQSLDLSHNRLQSLPGTVCSLTRLASLNLENNRLLVLPSALTRLSLLERLLLTGNESLQSPDYATCQRGLKVILEVIAQRGQHVNAWAGCQLTGAQHQHDSTDFPSLFSLASNTITTSTLDFLSVPFVPPRLKTFLVERSKFEITVAKCQRCRGFFSNSAMLEAHICTGKTVPRIMPTTFPSRT